MDAATLLPLASCAFGTPPTRPEHVRVPRRSGTVRGMKAWVVGTPGPMEDGPLELVDRPVPEPGAELRAEKGGLVMYGKQSTGDVNKSPAVVCGVGEILARGPSVMKGYAGEVEGVFG